MMRNIQNIKYDCRYFKGYIPCVHNKKEHSVCIDNENRECPYYSRSKENILIIKLGAAGDVIRTTPILYPLKNEHPYAFIYWLTDYPELVPTLDDNEYGVDRVYKWNEYSLRYLSTCSFDIIINLGLLPTEWVNFSKKMNSDQ
ncbi:MAG: hypothetical protein WAV76_12055 [Bacteroidota bacterium]